MADTPQTASLLAPHGDETLRRILDLLERSHRRTWMEVACAIILSLATTCSAWCAYQSKIWSGVQGSRSGQASGESRKAAQNRSRAFQIRSLEAEMFIKFFEAKQTSNEKLAQFFADRLPPQTKLALLAWWKTNPLDNPQAPPTPFDMEEYKQPQTVEAELHEKNAEQISTTVSDAGHHSDTYVLLTVLFASVLFFGGIGNTFESRRLRRIMIYISIALFLATFAELLSMPVHWD
jgi:hypothetical protein